MNTPGLCQSLPWLIIYKYRGVFSQHSTLYVDCVNVNDGQVTVMLCCIFRYELPQPTANQKHDITSWTEAVENSMAQLEHQAER